MLLCYDILPLHDPMKRLWNNNNKKQFLNNTTSLAIGNSQTNNHTGESKILEKTKRQDRTTRQMKRHILTIDLEVASDRVTYLSAAGEGL